MPIVRRIVFFLAAVMSLAADNGALAETGPCHSMEFERAEYAICEVDLHKHTVRLYWKRSNGTPYEYLSALPRSLEGGAGKLLFATNAGMFDSNLKPVGLYVEQGRELVHASTKSGWGNFHMKPNGIFYISADKAAVAETQSISQAATTGGLGDAIRADAGGRWALASSFRPTQHVAQNAQWRGRKRRWQSHIRHLSESSVV